MPWQSIQIQVKLKMRTHVKLSIAAVFPFLLFTISIPSIEVRNKKRWNMSLLCHSQRHQSIHTDVGYHTSLTAHTLHNHLLSSSHIAALPHRSVSCESQLMRRIPITLVLNWVFLTQFRLLIQTSPPPPPLHARPRGFSSSRYWHNDSLDDVTEWWRRLSESRAFSTCVIDKPATASTATTAACIASVPIWEFLVYLGKCGVE